MALLTKYRHFLLALVISLTALGKALHFCFVEGKSHTIIFMDAQGYYMYLPSVFIYENFKDFPLRDANGRLVHPKETVKNKYTYPVSFLQTPFFLVADLVAASDDTLPRDGRSWPYIVSILAAGAFYLGLGIYFLSRLLSSWFPFNVVALALLCVFLGTNLYYYSGIEAGVSHVYSFFLFASFWFVLDKFISRQRLGHFFLLGLIFGLILVLRPTNVILAILFFTYRINSWKEIRQRISVFFANPTGLLLLLLAIGLCISPQILYWKHAYGSWIVYSYGEEGFIYWNNPKIWQVLADVQNGWLLYSPIMIMAIIGIGILLKQKKFMGWGLFIMLCLATYTFASWWAWWFGGAFGHRSYVEYTSLLSFPLALTIQSILSLKIVLRIVAGLIFGLLLYYNLGLTEVYVSSGIPWDGPDWNWESYAGMVSKIF